MRENSSVIVKPEGRSEYCIMDSSQTVIEHFKDET